MRDQSYLHMINNRNSSVILLLLLLLSGCTGLIQSTETKLTGDWLMSGIDGESTSRDENRIGKLTLTFKENGTMITDLPGTMEYMAGTYSVEGKMLTMVIDGEPTEARIISIKKESLLIQPLDGEKELPFVLVFSKKKE